MVMTTTINDPLAVPPDTTSEEIGAQRVFVGIPDVFTTEQAARFHSLHMLEKWMWFDGAKKEPAASMTRLLEAADVLTGYILEGDSSIPESWWTSEE